MTSTSTQRPWLNELATELLVMIHHQLPKVSRIFLARTSKRMRAIFPEGFSAKELRLDEKLELLLDLERDDPRLVYCPDCCRLRKLQYDESNHTASMWRKTVNHEGCSGIHRGHHLVNEYHLNWRYPPTYHKKKDVWESQCDAWILNPSGLSISFFEAHAIMHRHRHGESYGLPIEGLKASYSFNRWLPLDLGGFLECNHWPLTDHVSGTQQRLTRSARTTTIERSRLQRPHARVRSQPRSMSQKRINRNGAGQPRRRLFRGRAPWRLHHDWTSAFAYDEAKRINQEPRPAPGIPPDAQLFPWQFQHGFDAQVIEDELYIRRSHHVACIVVDDGEEETTIQVSVLSRLQLPICDHVRLCHGTNRPLPYDYYLEVLNKGQSIVAPEMICLSSMDKVRYEGVRSCARCYTDYHLSLDWGQDGGRHAMALTTYHRLGPCKTVNERAWQALSHTDGPLRVEEWREFGAGSILSRWERAQGNEGQLTQTDQMSPPIVPRWSTSSYDKLYNPKLDQAGGLRTIARSRRRRYRRPPPSSRKPPLSFCGFEHDCVKASSDKHSEHTTRAYPSALWPQRLDALHLAAIGDRKALRRISFYELPAILKRAVFSDEDHEDKLAALTRDWVYKEETSTSEPTVPSVSGGWRLGWLEIQSQADVRHFDEAWFSTQLFGVE